MENLKASLDKVLAELGEALYHANMIEEIESVELKQIIGQLNTCSDRITELQCKLEEGYER